MIGFQPSLISLQLLLCPLPAFSQIINVCNDMHAHSRIYKLQSPFSIACNVGVFAADHLWLDNISGSSSLKKN